MPKGGNKKNNCNSFSGGGTARGGEGEANEGLWWKSSGGRRMYKAGSPTFCNKGEEGPRIYWPGYGGFMRRSAAGRWFHPR